MYEKFIVVLLCSCFASASVLLPAGDGYGVEDNIVESLHKSKAPSSIEECLRKDSISCAQFQIFRMAKEMFDRPSIDILNGVTFSKSSKFVDEARSLQSNGNQAEEKLSKAGSAYEREAILESYVAEEARNFFEKRNINWNIDVLARSLANATPEGFKGVISDLMTEGRGRKKVLKMLLPFLMGMKVKFVTVLALTYLGVVLLAKKALLLSIVSIAISVFLFIKKMYHHTEEVFPAAPGWQSHSDVGHVEYAAHNSPIAQQLAYNGPPKHRR